MAKHFTDERLLQSAEALFETLNTREEIAQTLAEYTYDEQKIKEGKLLFDKAKSLQVTNQKETKEEIQAYDAFSKTFQKVVEGYKIHRKKAKVIFKEDEATLKILALKGSIAVRHLSLLEDITKFYTELDKDNTFKSAVQKLKVTPQEIAIQLENISKSKTLYAKYTTEKGESQQATKEKNEAFEKLEKWIREFYTIAKIALDDKPQLLESLGKFIRS